MKKYLSLIILLAAVHFSNAQFVPQTQGAANTIVTSTGAITGKKGIVIPSFPDTVTANLDPSIKKTNGLLIKVGEDVYIRNQPLTKWVIMNSGGSLLFGIEDKIATANRYFDLGGNDFRFLNGGLNVFSSDSNDRARISPQEVSVKTGTTKAILLPQFLAFQTNLGISGIAGAAVSGQVTIPETGGMSKILAVSVNGITPDANGNIVYPRQLFTAKSVPFAGADGFLTEDNTGLSYDGNNLIVGHNNGFGGAPTGISMNAGRGYLSANGYGLVIGSSGGTPTDPSKSIRFFNSSIMYMKLWQPGATALHYDDTMELESSVHIMPSITDYYDLGRAQARWSHLFAKSINFSNLSTDQNVGDGKVLTSDADGIITLQSLPPVTAPVPDLWTEVSGSVARATGNVMIGSLVNDGENRLQVAGTGVFGNVRVGNGPVINSLTPYGIGIGFETLKSITTGAGGTAIGYQALSKATTISNSLAIGYQALKELISGDWNTAIGATSGAVMTTGYYNTLLGYGTGAKITTGFSNTALGMSAAPKLTTGSENIFIGAYAGFNNLTGTSNVVIGKNAGYQNSSAYENMLIGRSSGYSTTTGFRNVFIGESSGYNNTTGSYNTLLGNGTGAGITTGTGNTVIGALVTGLPAALTNNIILADGTGAIRLQVDNAGLQTLGTYGIGNHTTGMGAFSLQVDGNGNMIEGPIVGAAVPASWGSITGTLSSQTDLQSALTAKQNQLIGTFNGTTGQTYTFPTTTANIARTDAAQTFAGTQTFSGAIAANYTLNMLGTTPIIYAGNGASQTTSLTIQNTNPNTITSGAVTYLKISPSYNQTAATTSNTDFLLNRIQTSIGSGTQLLMDLQVGGASKFKVDNTGTANLAGGLAVQNAFSVNGVTPTIYAGNSVTANALTITVNSQNASASGSNNYLRLFPSYNQLSSTASNTDFLINRTETSVGSGTQLLMDLQVGGVSKFRVDNAGNIASTGILSTAGSIYGNLHSNTSSGSNATLQLTTAGAFITRNVADANPAFYVQQVNASSTGDILQLKNSANTVYNVTQAGSHLINIPNVATTNVYGLKVINPTAAAVGAQQFSPAISLQGSSWNTTTGTSRTAEWRIYNKTIQSTVDYGQLWFGVSYNGGAFTDIAGIDHAGGVFSTLGFSIPSKMTMAGGTNNGDIRLTASSGTGFGKFQMGGATSSYPAIAADGANIKIVDASGGNVSSLGVGISATARLTLPAGTATASSAPLQLTAGVFETTARSGVLETDATNDLAYTNSSLTRKYLATSLNKVVIAGVNTATLVAGTVTVNTSAVITASKIFVTVTTPGGTQGFLSVPTIVNGTSFTINSTSATETSTVNYCIIN